MSDGADLAPIVERWSEEARRATRARDLTIKAMRDAGASLSAIADASGLSKAGVARILRRLAAEVASRA